MRRKTRTLILLGLVLGVVGAWFWPLRHERRADSRAADSTVAAGGPAAIALQFTNPLAAWAAAAATGGVSAQFEVITTEGIFAPLTNGLALRLTNTAQALPALLRSERAVLLRNALIDTALGGPKIPEHLRAKGDPGAYIVQARGATSDEFRAVLAAAGAEMVSYVPNNAYLVRASAGVAGALGASPLTQAVLPFEPYYKLDASLLRLAVKKELSPYGLLNVVSFPGQAERMLAALKQLGAEPVGEGQVTVFGEVWAVKVPADKTAEAAQISEVQMLGVRFEKRLANDLTRVITRISTNIPFSTNVPIVRPPESHYRTASNFLTGEGVIVAVADTGVDQTHPDLLGRILQGSYLGPGGKDYDGHGTHVVGTFIGDGTQSPLPNGAALGSHSNAVFSGMAPRAKALVQDYRRADSPLQRETVVAGALISNNSWGFGGNNDYDIFAASYDAAVRDSTPGITGEQEVAYVFAAGNEGGGGDNGLQGTPGSVISPATGKNVITVGGSDLPRHITNEVFKCTTITNLTSTNLVCETNAPWAGMTDTNNQVAPFSSRGNVGIGIEGLFGRFKPDVVAPGAMLVSTRSKDYLEPDGITNTFPFTFNNISIGMDRTNIYTLVIPAGTIRFQIFINTNVLSPTNLTLGLGAGYTPAAAAVTITNNYLNLDATTTPALAPGRLYYSIANTNHAPNANFDLILLLTVTNNVGNYFTVLRQLNAPLKVGNHGYRYEAGTSMAAPAVSGFLALIQEYLATNFNARPSPALLKALAINGARSLSPNYNLQINAPINHQGWGLVNLSNSIPFGLTPGGSNGPMRFYDQKLTNSLATGGTETYEITVPDEAKSFPLRVTLVWTDPPGNPVTGIKLVNDLNLTVLGDRTNTVVVSTNSSLTNSTAQIYIGNNFPPGSDFTEPIVLSSTDTNVVAPTNLTEVINATRDIVNNVENVYIQPPLSSSYTVVVKAHRVNVQAVNSHSNSLAQDYALVISSGNIVPANNVNLIVNGPMFTNDFTPRLAALVRATNATSAGLLNQRVGANNPLIVSTNGATNQWAFFTYTNVPTANFTNVAILTFLPPNLSLSRYREADIDLYVHRNGQSTGSNLFLLDPAAITASAKSLRRGGTEVLVFNNAAPNEVFYIGVKSEDQQAANFALYALSSDVPFSSRDSSNNIIISARGLPIPIPDGSPEQPGGTNIVMIVSPLDWDQNIARIYATNAIFHEEAGDLVGILNRLSGTNAVTLSNHRTWTEWENPVFPHGVIYDDSSQGDLGDEFTTPPVFLPDGPGRLRDFIGDQAGPAWNFTISDNALFHTGYVDNVTLVIEPASTNRSNPNIIIDRRFCVNPGTWVYAAANIPSDAYNMETCVSDFETPLPIQVFIKEGAFPDFGYYDYLFEANPPGECLDVGLGDNPPLFPGRWYIGFYNSNAAPVCFHARVTISRKSIAGPYAKYVSSDTPKSLIDDAKTNSLIFVPDRGRVSDLRVGLRVDHERASDLAFHLTSPSGTRLLLMENRGRTNARGIGVNFTNVVTNVVRTVLKEGFDNTPPRGCAIPNDTIYSPEIFAGWRVVRGSVDVMHDTCGFTGPAAHSQPHALDMDGQDPGTVETNITTIPGKRYRLSFAYSQTPGFGAKSNWVHLTGQPSFVLVSDQTNTATDLRWQTTSFVFTATSVGTLLQLESLSTCCSGGMYLDTFQMDQLEVKTNLYIYAGFTENTNLAELPIKFAVPPFGSTNINFQVPVKDDFETALPGEYAAPAFVGSWSVATNQVSVIDDPTLARSGSRLLALADAQITRTFPTRPGYSYTVSFAYRDSGIESWWPAEADYQDIVSGNNGTPYNGVDFRPGEVNFGFDFPGDFGRSPRIDVGNPENLKLTNSLTIEGWVFADNLNPGNLGRNHIIFRGADDTARDAYKLSIWEADHFLRFSIDNNATEALLLYPNRMPEGEWLHVTATLEDVSGLMKLYTNGSLIAQLTTGIRPYADRRPGQLTPNVTIGNHPLGTIDNSWDGVIDELSVYHRALSPSEVRAIYRAGARGKYDPFAPSYVPQVAKARVEIEGSGDLLLADSSWRTASYTFTAVSNSATLRLRGYALGILLDGFEAWRDDSDTEWYLPEEPLTPFFGENSFGQWSLEVWDSRLGGLINNFNPQLLSWRLDMATPQGNPPSTFLTDGSKHTNIVRGAETRYFIVDLPCSTGLVTNTLRVLSSTTAGLQLTFNNFTLPTNGPGDIVLMSAVRTTDTVVLPMGTYPLVSPPRYHLAVQNVDPTETNDFVLSIDLDCSASPLVALANNKRQVARIAPGMLQTYSYTTANDVVQLTFEVSQAGGNIDLLVQRDTAAGISGTASYASRHPGTAHEWIVLTTNTVPVPLAGAAPWYAAVQNVSTGTPPYFVKVTEVRQGRVHSISANTTFARQNLPPSEIDYYVVSFPTNILNAVFNLSVNSGEADLYLGRGTFPTTTLNEYQSTWAGSDYLSVGTQSTPPIAPGEWRIAVANPGASTVSSYFLNALVSTNANPGDSVTIRTSSSLYSSNEFMLKWTAPAGQEFRVEYTDVLPSEWRILPGSVTSTNGEFVFTDFSAQTGQRFYRLVRVR
jgi:subtilisin family serine protease/subtilisin-like proprotein convertase family protein